MAEFTTPNGVRVQFDNNTMQLRDGAPPLIEFDAGGNLVGVHFDGYEIRPIPYGASPAPDVEARLAEIDCQIATRIDTALRADEDEDFVNSIEPSTLRDALRAALVAEGEARNLAEKAIQALEATLTALAAARQENARLREALEEVDELIDGYVDVADGADGQPRANDAMLARDIIHKALASPAPDAAGQPPGAGEPDDFDPPIPFTPDGTMKAQFITAPEPSAPAPCCPACRAVREAAQFVHDENRDAFGMSALCAALSEPCSGPAGVPEKEG